MEGRIGGGTCWVFSEDASSWLCYVSVLMFQQEESEKVFLVSYIYLETNGNKIMQFA